jgi:methionyl-tRNA synthetase
MDKKTFYITTPLYYPSGKWHLGHSYTTVCCDAIARFRRKQGYDVFYLTGTDEHGQKIAERASQQGKSPKEYVDVLCQEIKQLWQLLDIKYDKFIRTTDNYHVESVQKIFKQLFDQGDIYKSTYKGKYCTPCEAFWTQQQLVDGKCPDCGREVTEAEEECYFFRLSKYSDSIEKLLKETDYLQPKERVNEMINNFIKTGLSDIAVSRTSVKWGISVSFDQKHTVYVWIDALSNYINACGYNGQNENMRFWPADLHVVGKEIVRFHAIIWPAILMALQLPLPKKVFGHGWLLLSGDKMSKSKGNVVDPFVLCERYGTDALRYYLLREIPFGSDGVYSSAGFIDRINSDLCNDLGNLVKRTVAMANQYFGGKVHFCGSLESDQPLIEMVNGLRNRVENAMDMPSCSKALEEIFLVVRAANKYIDLTSPWILFREGKTERLMQVMYSLLETIRICACMLSPFIVSGTEKILKILGKECGEDFSTLVFGKEEFFQTSEDEIIYKRLDKAKELLFLDGTDAKDSSEAEAANIKKAENKKTTQKGNEKEIKMEQNEGKACLEEEKAEEFISIDDFAKCKLLVAEILQAEKVEKTDKLLKLRLKVGESERTVVSGIALAYSPEDVIGKKVVLLANLKSAKLRGILSEGMLLCAGQGKEVVLLSPEKDMPSGTEIG